ncbi:MAG: tetratricopeptide repeat protein [Bacteroidetes bacterium]|nr:tetratricopeptide repeat protein [Bacteroidota bacterium]
MIKKLFLFAITGLLFFCAKAQSKKIDSLLNVIKVIKNDTALYSAYVELGNKLRANNPDTALYFHTQAKKIANKTQGVQGFLKESDVLWRIAADYFFKGDVEQSLKSYQESLDLVKPFFNDKDTAIQKKAKTIQVKALGGLANNYYTQRNYPKALEFYFKTLQIAQDIGNKKTQAINLGNIGLVYASQGSFSQSLEYHFKSLKINEEIQDKLGQAKNLGNIGSVYYRQNEYEKALTYYLKTLKISEEIENIPSQMEDLHNIGTVYFDQKKYAPALLYFVRALKISVETKNESNQLSNLCNIGNVYFAQKQYQNALPYYEKALKMSEEIQDETNEAISLSNLGAVYLNQNKYAQAETYLKKAVQIGEKLKTIYSLSDFYEHLFELYTRTHRYPDALEAYKKHIACRDSILSEENQKALVVKEMQYNYNKEEEKQRAEQLIKDTQNNNEKHQQRLTIYVVICFSVFLLIVVLVILKNLRISKKKSHIINLQKREVERQKHLVEEKNKDITDSINYAKHLQESILPDIEEINQYAANFVLYQPKDIVAGDFYFFRNLSPYEYLIAVADCTGHGVPGALTSVVCSQKLHEVIDKGITQPAHILTEVNKEVKKVFRKKLNDGMDITLLKINTQTNSLFFAGANRPLVTVYQQELIEYKGVKSAIGHSSLSDEAFTQQELSLAPGTMLYLFSDGYADQFGGPKNKKLSTKKLKETLQEASTMDLTKQKEFLQHFFADYKGIYEQVDDVCVVGIRV